MFNRVKDTGLTTYDNGRFVVRDYICGEMLNGRKTLMFVVPNMGTATMDCKSGIFETDGDIGRYLLELLAEHACTDARITVQTRAFPRSWVMRNLRRVFDEIKLKDQNAVIILKDQDTGQYVCGALADSEVGPEGEMVSVTVGHSNTVFNPETGISLRNLAFHSVVPSLPNLVLWTLNENFEYTIFEYLN